ncbi:MAG: hypothetical protein ABH879_00310 [archaeon]
MSVEDMVRGFVFDSDGRLVEDMRGGKYHMPDSTGERLRLSTNQPVIFGYASDTVETRRGWSDLKVVTQLSIDESRLSLNKVVTGRVTHFNGHLDCGFLADETPENMHVFFHMDDVDKADLGHLPLDRHWRAEYAVRLTSRGLRAVDIHPLVPEETAVLHTLRNRKGIALRSDGSTVNIGCDVAGESRLTYGSAVHISISRRGRKQLADYVTPDKDSNPLHYGVLVPESFPRCIKDVITGRIFATTLNEGEGLVSYRVHDGEPVDITPVDKLPFQTMPGCIVHAAGTTGRVASLHRGRSYFFHVHDLVDTTPEYDRPHFELEKGMLAEYSVLTERESRAGWLILSRGCYASRFEQDVSAVVAGFNPTEKNGSIVVGKTEIRFNSYSLAMPSARMPDITGKWVTCDILYTEAGNPKVFNLAPL